MYSVHIYLLNLFHYAVFLCVHSLAEVAEGNS